MYVLRSGRCGFVTANRESWIRCLTIDGRGCGAECACQVSRISCQHPRVVATRGVRAATRETGPVLLKNRLPQTEQPGPEAMVGPANDMLLQQETGISKKLRHCVQLLCTAPCRHPERMEVTPVDRRRQQRVADALLANFNPSIGGKNTVKIADEDEGVEEHIAARTAALHDRLSTLIGAEEVASLDQEVAEANVVAEAEERQRAEEAEAKAARKKAAAEAAAARRKARRKERDAALAKHRAQSADSEKTKNLFLRVARHDQVSGEMTRRLSTKLSGRFLKVSAPKTKWPPLRKDEQQVVAKLFARDRTFKSPDTEKEAAKFWGYNGVVKLSKAPALIVTCLEALEPDVLVKQEEVSKVLKQYPVNAAEYNPKLQPHDAHVAEISLADVLNRLALCLDDRDDERSQTLSETARQMDAKPILHLLHLLLICVGMFSEVLLDFRLCGFLRTPLTRSQALDVDYIWQHLPDFGMSRGTAELPWNGEFADYVLSHPNGNFFVYSNFSCLEPIRCGESNDTEYINRWGEVIDSCTDVTNGTVLLPDRGGQCLAGAGSGSRTLRTGGIQFRVDSNGTVISGAESGTAVASLNISWYPGFSWLPGSGKMADGGLPIEYADQCDVPTNVYGEGGDLNWLVASQQPREIVTMSRQQLRGYFDVGERYYDRYYEFGDVFCSSISSKATCDTYNITSRPLDDDLSNLPPNVNVSTLDTQYRCEWNVTADSCACLQLSDEQYAYFAYQYCGFFQTSACTLQSLLVPCVENPHYNPNASASNSTAFSSTTQSPVTTPYDFGNFECLPDLVSGLNIDNTLFRIFEHGEGYLTRLLEAFCAPAVTTLSTVTNMSTEQVHEAEDAVFNFTVLDGVEVDCDTFNLQVEYTAAVNPVELQTSRILWYINTSEGYFDNRNLSMGTTVDNQSATTELVYYDTADSVDWEIAIPMQTCLLPTVAFESEVYGLLTVGVAAVVLLCLFAPLTIVLGYLTLCRCAHTGNFEAVTAYKLYGHTFSRQVALYRVNRSLKDRAKQIRHLKRLKTRQRKRQQKATAAAATASAVEGTPSEEQELPTVDEHRHADIEMGMTSSQEWDGASSGEEADADLEDDTPVESKAKIEEPELTEEQKNIANFKHEDKDTKLVARSLTDDAIKGDRHAEDSDDLTESDSDDEGVDEFTNTTATQRCCEGFMRCRQVSWPKTRVSRHKQRQLHLAQQMLDARVARRVLRLLKTAHAVISVARLVLFASLIGALRCFLGPTSAPPASALTPIMSLAAHDWDEWTVVLSARWFVWPTAVLDDVANASDLLDPDVHDAGIIQYLWGAAAFFVANQIRFQWGDAAVLALTNSDWKGARGVIRPVAAFFAILIPTAMWIAPIANAFLLTEIRYIDNAASGAAAGSWWTGSPAVHIVAGTAIFTSLWLMGPVRGAATELCRRSKRTANLPKAEEHDNSEEDVDSIIGAVQVEETDDGKPGHGLATKSLEITETLQFTNVASASASGTGHAGDKSSNSGPSNGAKPALGPTSRKNSSLRYMVGPKTGDKSEAVPSVQPPPQSGSTSNSELDPSSLGHWVDATKLASMGSNPSKPVFARMRARLFGNFGGVDAAFAEEILISPSVIAEPLSRTISNALAERAVKHPSREKLDTERDKKLIMARLLAFATTDGPVQLVPGDDGRELAFKSRRYRVELAQSAFCCCGGCPVVITSTQIAAVVLGVYFILGGAMFAPIMSWDQMMCFHNGYFISLVYVGIAAAITLVSFAFQVCCCVSCLCYDDHDH